LPAAFVGGPVQADSTTGSVREARMKAGMQQVISAGVIIPFIALTTTGCATSTKNELR